MHNKISFFQCHLNKAGVIVNKAQRNQNEMNSCVIKIPESCEKI